MVKSIKKKSPKSIIKKRVDELNNVIKHIRRMKKVQESEHKRLHK